MPSDLLYFELERESATERRKILPPLAKRKPVPSEDVNELVGTVRNLKPPIADLDHR